MVSHTVPPLTPAAPPAHPLPPLQPASLESMGGATPTTAQEPPLTPTPPAAPLPAARCPRPPRPSARLPGVHAHPADRRLVLHRGGAGQAAHAAGAPGEAAGGMTVVMMMMLQGWRCQRGGQGLRCCLLPACWCGGSSGHRVPPTLARAAVCARAAWAAWAAATGTGAPAQLPPWRLWCGASRQHQHPH